MKKTSIITTLTIFLAIHAVVSSTSAVSSPEIPADKFTSCNSKAEKDVIESIKPFSINRTQSGEQINCTAGVDGFQQDGHKPDESSWDSVNKRCLLTKKFCFIGKEWA
jgi:hypothetical protein